MRSEETRQRMSLSHTGKRFSDDTKKRMSESRRKRSKIQNEIVKDIRILGLLGYSTRKINEKYPSLTMASIRGIVSGRIYKHVN